MMAIETLDRAIERAEKKLERIIEREGDADGKRLNPRYLFCLIAEELKLIEWSECNGRSHIVEIQRQR